MVAMARTNVDVNDRLLRRAMKLYGFRTKREAINRALLALVGDKTPKDMLDLHGLGWEGNLEEMRRTRFPEL